MWNNIALPNSCCRESCHVAEDAKANQRCNQSSLLWCKIKPKEQISKFKEKSVTVHLYHLLQLPVSLQLQTMHVHAWFAEPTLMNCKIKIPSESKDNHERASSDKFCAVLQINQPLYSVECNSFFCKP